MSKTHGWLIAASLSLVGCQMMADDRASYHRTQDYEAQHGYRAVVYKGNVPLGVGQYGAVAVSEYLKAGEVLILSPQAQTNNGQWFRSQPTWRAQRLGHNNQPSIDVCPLVNGLIKVTAIRSGRTLIVFNDPAVDRLYPGLEAWQQDVTVEVK